MDLFFKNTPYFVSVYLNFSWWEYLITVAVCYVLLHLLIYCVTKSSLKRTIVLSAVFSFYFALIIGMTLLGDNRDGVTGIIIDPLYGIKKVVFEGNVHFLRGMLSNVLFFLPCGVFYRILDYKYNVFKGLVYSALISLFLESMQYLFGVGYFETSDILCNIVGAMVGIGITELVYLIVSKTKNQVKE